MEFTTTQQRIAAIGHQPVLKKSTFIFALAIFGVLVGVGVITRLAMGPQAKTGIIEISNNIRLRDRIRFISTKFPKQDSKAHYNMG